MEKNNLRIVLFVILTITLSAYLGFTLGKNQANTATPSTPNQELAKLQVVNQNVIDFYQELSSDEKGVEKGTRSELFDSAKMRFNSPLFQGKTVTSYTYQFKGDIIIEKNLEIGDGIDLYVAEYHPRNNPSMLISGFPPNFVTFLGYENYSLTPSYVGPRVMMWDSSTQYVPKLRSESDQQQIYYEETEYTPRQIGTAVLTTYVRYFQGVKDANYPILLSLRTSLSHPVSSTDDLIFRQAIDDLKPIIDTITYGNLE